MGILEDFQRAFDPAKNGLTDSVNKTNKAAKKALDPGANGVTAAFNKGFSPTSLSGLSAILVFLG